jgi:hypothetical protein
VAKTDDASGMIDMCQKKLKSAKKIGCPVQWSQWDFGKDWQE